MPAVIRSTFDADFDGWTIQGDVAGTDYVATGGNPGGYIHWVDAAAGADSYWIAASKFLGDKSEYYGGYLSYDIENSSAGYSGAPDVKLIGSDLTLVIALGQPGTTWTHYSAQLTEGAGWKVGDLSGTTATAEQIQHVLMTLEAINIRAEYENGGENGGLDNVEMRPVPDMYKLYDGPAENVLLGEYSGYAGVITAASPGNEIALDNDYVGNISAQISVENLYFRGGAGLVSEFVLASNITTFSVVGTTSSRIIGNSKNNFLYGNDGDNVFVGGLGNDRLDGGSGSDTADYSASTHSMAIDLSKGTPQATAGFGSDTLVSIENLITGSGNDRLLGDVNANTLKSGMGNDKLYGFGDNDRLEGADGADLLDGGEGADVMKGGAGADTYYVDNADDTVIEENIGPGGVGPDDGSIDKVFSTITYTLGDFVENLTLTGMSVIDGTGNSLNNTITGNSAANVLDGGDGNDKLLGGDGADTLRGGKGADTLTGGFGADDMDGGEDADTYYVGSGDTIHDSGTTGIDRVIAVAGFTATTGDGIERIDTLSSSNVSLIGNELGNYIYGGEGADIIKGLAGSDALYGGGGGDKLEGGAGRDFLYGQGGADRFIFKNGDAGATATTFDVIKDFVASDGDRIDLDVVTKALTDGQYAERTIANDAYGTAYNAAVAAMADGDHVAVFVAGTANGYLFWNTDANTTTPDQSVRLDGVNNVALFDKSFIV